MISSIHLMNKIKFCIVDLFPCLCGLWICSLGAGEIGEVSDTIRESQKGRGICPGPKMCSRIVTGLRNKGETLQIRK